MTRSPRRSPLVLTLGYTLFMAWLRKTRETALGAAETTPTAPEASGPGELKPEQSGQ